MDKPMYFKDPQDATLFNELRKRVKDRVSTVKTDKELPIKIKAVVLPLLYFSLYGLALTQASHSGLYLGLFALMGITLVLIYLNLIHEAAHNNIFRSKALNRAVLYLFDAVGANSYIWKKRHLVSHHAYPNVQGWDTDVEQSGVIKIFPHGKARGLERYQHRIFFLIYPLYLFNWMFVRDFRDFFDKRRVISKTQTCIPTIEKVKLIVFKLAYFFYQIFLPVLFFEVEWSLALSGWLLQILVGSCFALFVLLPLHPLPENEFPVADSNLQLPYSWVRHQLEVTNDLKQNNWFVRHILGNFNFHVAHHLFPNYSYSYYNEITEEIAQFAREKQLPYKRFGLFEALGKHYQLLKSNATSIGEVMEETM